MSYPVSPFDKPVMCSQYTGASIAQLRNVKLICVLLGAGTAKILSMLGFLF